MIRPSPATRLLTAVALALGFSSASAHALTIIHSNDVLGDIEPCGCRGLPKGGMIRKEALLRSIRDSERVQLDAGDLLFSTDSMPELLQSQSQLQASYLLKAMDLLNHDAAVPGEKDLGLGLEVFEQLRKNARLQFLAANASRKGGKEWLKPYLLLSRKSKAGREIRIGIVGLLGEALRWPAEIQVEPAIPVARKIARELRGKVDLLIALTHEGHTADRLLAEAVPDFDLIIGGHTQAYLQKPVRISNVTLLETAYQNQFIGVLPISEADLASGPVRKPLNTESYDVIALDELYEPAPAARGQDPSPMQKLVAEFKAAAGEAAKLREKELQQLTAKQALRNSSGETWQGAAKCGECHQKALRFWKKTAHARALEVLKKKGKDKDPACLGCHALPAEASLSGGKPKLKIAGVQCESCHGPGKDHPFSGGYSKIVADETCLRCHTPKWSPGWYKDGVVIPTVLQSKRPGVSCPKGTD